MFALKAPCGNCPFLKVGAIDLQPGRVEGIATSLIEDDHSHFSCHKTLSGSRKKIGPGESMCAGSMIYLQKVGRMNVAMRLGIITGLYNHTAMALQYDKVIDEMPLCEENNAPKDGLELEDW